MIMLIFRTKFIFTLFFFPDHQPTLLHKDDDGVHACCASGQAHPGTMTRHRLSHENVEDARRRYTSTSPTQWWCVGSYPSYWTTMGPFTFRPRCRHVPGLPTSSVIPTGQIRKFIFIPPLPVLWNDPSRKNSCHKATVISAPPKFAWGIYEPTSLLPYYSGDKGKPFHFNPPCYCSTTDLAPRKFLLRRHSRLGLNLCWCWCG
jgi:hypothetical protein